MSDGTQQLPPHQTVSDHNPVPSPDPVSESECPTGPATGMSNVIEASVPHWAGRGAENETTGTAEVEPKEGVPVHLRTPVGRARADTVL